MSQEPDEAAHALAVVSVQKEQDLRVELPASGEVAPAGEVSPARGGAYAFKAGSPLPDDRIDPLNVSRIFLVRDGDELYAIEADELRAEFPAMAAQMASRTGTIDLRNTLTVRAAFTVSEVAELIRTIGVNNIVRYDGWFYVVPHQCGVIRWGEEDPRVFPGVVVAASAREAVAIAERALTEAPRRRSERALLSDSENKGRATPLLIKAVGNYNIVEYEGWYYGLPHALGRVDLEKVDVIEMKGVIRDVSAEVVEREIQELQH